MFAASTAAAIIVHVAGALAFISFGVLGRHAVRLWCDNEAAVLAAKDATSIKRLAYIARRVRFLQELVAYSVIEILDIDGKRNPADALTKHISPKIAFSEYMGRMYNIATSLFRLKALTK